MNDGSTNGGTMDDTGTALRSMGWRLLARRVLVARIAALVVLATLVTSLVLPRWYSSSLSFTPQQSRRNPAGNLSGLAAQFGVALPATEASQSPNFYAQLVTSRAILGEISALALPVDSAGAGRKVPLADLLDVDETDPRARHEEVVKELRKRISTNADVRTGVVTIGVRMHDPVASWRLGEALLQALSRYNLVTRQGQARAERRFAEQRMREAASELRAAEERMREFLAANRVYERSPTLALEEQRLQRDISTKSQVYSGIVQAFEQARLEEVRDTPVLSVIDRPVIAARPDSMRLGVRLVLAGALGLAGGIVVAVLLDVIARLRAGALRAPDEASIAQGVAHDLVRPWRLVFRRAS